MIRYSAYNFLWTKIRSANQAILLWRAWFALLPFRSFPPFERVTETTNGLKLLSGFRQGLGGEASGGDEALPGHRVCRGRQPRVLQA